MSKKIGKYWGKSRLGVIELLFAFYPILSGYAYGIVRLDLLILVVMDFIAFYRSKRLLDFKPLFYLFIYVLLHEFVLFFFLKGMPVYHLNSLLSTTIFLSSIFIIVPAINYKKLSRCLFLVGILSMVGILYHFMMIRNGGEIHPIKLPFLPDLSEDSRLFSFGNRPTSFYWEPAAFVTYMMVPLFLSLNERRYVWTLIITLSIFLSTSSTGILLSVMMVGVYVFTQKIRMLYRVLLSVAGVALVLFLLQSELFESGIQKIENTDVEKTTRLINGPRLVFNMPSEHLITGMVSANVNDYYQDGYVSTYLQPTRSGTIFVSTFWSVLAKFGLVGLLLYLNVYVKFIKNRRLLPYVTILLIALFSQGFVLSAIFVFQMIFMLSFLKMDVEVNS